MKAKLVEYINTIFADAEAASPDNRRLSELKEEMLQNLNEKYDDLVAEGKSPAAAYNIAVSSIGDISELLESVTGTPLTAGAPRQNAAASTPPKREPLSPEEEEILRKYRSRSAILTSVAIALYILCTVPCILLGDDIIGPTIMFLMVAAATAMLIFNGMSKPKLLRELDDDGDDDECDDEAESGRRDAAGHPRRSPVYNAISGALWILTVCAYLAISFLSNAWHITWLLFLIAVALDNVIKAIFDLRR